MKKQILLEFERGGQVTATLLEDVAPKTCEAVLSALPFEGKVVHAMYAGEEIVATFPLSGELEYENAIYEVKPGDLALVSTYVYNPSRPKGQTNFCIFYGISRPRKTIDQTAEVNVFARVDDLEKIVEIGKRVRLNGREKIWIKARP